MSAVGMRAAAAIASLLAVATACSSHTVADACAPVFVPSAVTVRASTGWIVNSICANSRCVYKTKYTTTDLSVPVSSHPSSYRYRIVAHSAHGKLFHYVGSIVTQRPWKGNGVCGTATTAAATLGIDFHGHIANDARSP